MSDKKIVSAVMALTMAASMTALSASAEEDTASFNEDVPTATEAQVQAVETEEEPANPVGDMDTPAETVPDQETNAPEQPETTAPPMIIETENGLQTTVSENTTENGLQTTASEITTTEAAQTTEVISDSLGVPKMGEFKTTDVTDGAGGQSSVISWEAVKGADGYQVYRTVVEKDDEDMPTSYAFDVKGTSYQTSGSVPYKETIKVRAFQIINGSRVYGAWSEEKTVYLNGMQPDTGTAVSTTTTASAKTTTKATTTTAKSTTTTSADKKTESPKTGDASAVAGLFGGASAALLAGVATKKKRK